MITAGGVTAGIDFALTVVAELASVAAAEEIQLMLEYAPAPPFDAGTPATASSATLAGARARLAATRTERAAVIDALCN